MTMAGIEVSNGGRSEVGLEPTGQPSFPGLEQLVGWMLGEKQSAQKAASGGRVDIEMGE